MLPSGMKQGQAQGRFLSPGSLRPGRRHRHHPQGRNPRMCPHRMCEQARRARPAFGVAIPKPPTPAKATIYSRARRPRIRRLYPSPPPSPPHDTSSRHAGTSISSFVVYPKSGKKFSGHPYKLGWRISFEWLSSISSSIFHADKNHWISSFEDTHTNLGD